MGVLVNRKRYPLVKYLRVGLMVLGVALFMYHPGVYPLAPFHFLFIPSFFLLNN